MKAIGTEVGLSWMGECQHDNRLKQDASYKEEPPAAQKKKVLNGASRRRTKDIMIFGFVVTMTNN